MTNLCRLTTDQVTLGIKNRDFSAEEYICQILDRIEKVDVKINAFITVDKKGALQKAQLIDKKIHNSEQNIGPLAGVAVGIKDNINTNGLNTTCASKMLKDYVSPYDATTVKRLRESDAIVIGKLNLDEFAMGSTTEFSKNGPTHNPWNTDYVAGGSSGGSAASVAALECAVSLGSDTGGSIRCPASFCSVVGLKPTYGSVSRYGLISYANSLEQIGPIGKTASDVAMVMNAIAGKDDKDYTTLEWVPKYTLHPTKKNIRVGLVKQLVEGADKAISKCIYNAMDLFSKLDFECEETSMNSIRYSLPSYYTIAMAEASSNLARYDNIRYGFDLNPDGYEWNTYFSKVRSNFGQEVKRRIIIGSYVLSAGYYGKYYLKAQMLRSLLKQELESFFKKYDILIAPTMPVLPFKIGDKIDDPLKMYLIDIDTVIANLSGIPAISIPAGFHNDLPIGLQIMANELQEQTILDAAMLFEKASNIQRTPDL